MILPARTRRGLIAALMLAAIILVTSLADLFYSNLSDWGENTKGEMFSYYPTAAELVTFLTDLQTKYDQLVKIDTIGYSLSGKPLLAVTIAAPGAIPAAERPALLVVAEQHGREPIACLTAAYALSDLLQRSSSDTTVQYLLTTRTIYWVPQANPDGNDLFLSENSGQRGNARSTDLDGDGQLSEDGRESAGLGTLQRQFFQMSDAWIEETDGDVFQEGWKAEKSAGDYQHILNQAGSLVTAGGRTIKQLDNDNDGKTNEDELVGVDLNRNWDAAWEQGNGDPTSALYRGASPFSEPETAAIRDFVLSHTNIVSGLDMHSGTSLILMPWSRSAEDTPDQEILDQLARKGSELTKVAHAVASQGLYPAYGSLKDWLYQQGILALAPEVYGASQFSKVVHLWPSNWYLTFGSLAEQFNPPPTEITQTADRWKPFIQYMIAALPEVSVTDFRLDGQSLSFRCGNSGLIAGDPRIELWRGNRLLFTEDLTDLSLESRQVTVTKVVDGDYRLLLTTKPQIAVAARVPFTQEILFRVQSGKLVGTEQLVTQPDLGEAFAGLTAPIAPYEADEWHLR